MEHIIKYIENHYELKCEKEELTEEEQKELDFLNKFIKDCNFKDTVSLVNINRYEYLAALLSGATKIGHIEYIKEKVNMLRLDTITNYKVMFEISSIISEMKNDDIYDLVKELPLKFDKDNEIAKKLEKLNKLESAKELNNLLRGSVVKDDESKQVFFELYDLYLTNLILIISSIAILNDNKLKVNVSNDTNKQNNRMITFNEYSKTRENCETLSDLIKSTFDICRINRFYNDVIEKINSLKALPKEREKGNKLIRRKKEKVLSILSSLDTSKPITFSPSFLDSLGSDKIKYFIIKRATAINLKLQDETVEELNKEKLTSIIEKLFKKSCFSYEDLNEEEKINLSTYGNLDEIEKMLNIFTESNINIYNNSFPIYDILMLSKSTIVSEITKLIEARVITEEFVLKNPSIFVEKIPIELFDKVAIKEENYNTFTANINLFKEKKYDTRLISKFDGRILLRNNEYNNQITNLIALYELNYDNSNNYSLFINPKLIDIVDKFIELGLSEYIVKHPYVINENANTIIERLQLLKELDIPLLIDNKLNPKVFQKDFRLGKNLISDEDIKEFIPNMTDNYINNDMVNILKNNKEVFIDLEEIPGLEKYATSKFEYNFDGVIISRLKVLRNYHILKSQYEGNDDQILFDSIIFESTLNHEMIDTLRNLLINNKILQKKKY